MNKFMVVMAGGGGSRFWPLSRLDFPKQFLPLSGRDAMINETIKRVDTLFSPERTFIVTGFHQKAAMKSVLLSFVPRENILYEPMPKNTAPCILYAALHIWRTQGDGVMCVFSADHHITNEPEFLRVLNKAIITAEKDKVVTIGITPTFPSTGYGYVKRGAEQMPGVYALDTFVEKPDKENAYRYITSGDYYWNSGMFVWKVSVVIELFKQYLPDMYETFMTEKSVDEIFSKLARISVDYGIMEHLKDALVVPGDFGWSDIGSWDTLGDVIAPNEQGNVLKGDFVGLESTDNIVYSKNKLVTAIGVKDLIIVEAGDVLLVCAKDRAQDIKLLVNELQKTGYTQCL